MKPAERALRDWFNGHGEGADANEWLDAALAEAREEGRRIEIMDSTNLTSDEQGIVRAARAKVRREALEEAARVAHAIDTVAGDEVRALMDQPPPDTGWRDRPPTPAEVEAHDGLWLWLDHEDPDVPAPYELMLCDGAIFTAEHDPLMMAELHSEGDRWRPVDRELWPAPWPTTEGDAV
jgi:hypothetical protein